MKKVRVDQRTSFVFAAFQKTLSSGFRKFKRVRGAGCGAGGAGKWRGGTLPLIVSSLYPPIVSKWIYRFWFKISTGLRLLYQRFFGPKFCSCQVSSSYSLQLSTVCYIEPFLKCIRD